MLRLASPLGLGFQLGNQRCHGGPSHAQSSEPRARAYIALVVHGHSASPTVRPARPQWIFRVQLHGVFFLDGAPGTLVSMLYAMFSFTVLSALCAALLWWHARTNRAPRKPLLVVVRLFEVVYMRLGGLTGTCPCTPLNRGHRAQGRTAFAVVCCLPSTKLADESSRGEALSYPSLSTHSMLSHLQPWACSCRL